MAIEAILFICGILAYYIYAMNEKKYKNPVCVIYWRDAAYVYDKNFPDEEPSLQVTAGFTVKANDSYVNIATNINYNRATGELWPVDGFIIPKSAIVEFKKIGFLNNE